MQGPLLVESWPTVAQLGCLSIAPVASHCSTAGLPPSLAQVLLLAMPEPMLFLSSSWLATPSCCLAQVLLLAMLEPRSYTAEDVIEIHTHGGGISAQRVLQVRAAEESHALAGVQRQTNQMSVQAFGWCSISSCAAGAQQLTCQLTRHAKCSNHRAAVPGGRGATGAAWRVYAACIPQWEAGPEPGGERGTGALLRLPQKPAAQRLGKLLPQGFVAWQHCPRPCTCSWHCLL